MDTLYNKTMKRTLTASNATLALASALMAVTLGHTFNYWKSTDYYATAKNVDAKEIWELANYTRDKKATAKRTKRIKHTAPQPDPTPTTPAPAMPLPDRHVPKFVAMARIDCNMAA